MSHVKAVTRKPGMEARAPICHGRLIVDTADDRDSPEGGLGVMLDLDAMEIGLGRKAQQLLKRRKSLVSPTRR
jgi:hypothetical protein